MNSPDITIGQIVAEDYRTAAVFKKHKIDFCCRGNRSLYEVCEEKQLNPDKILNELSDAKTKMDSTAIDFSNWDMDLLADYIEKKHHRYVERTIPVLLQYLNKLCKVHGPLHPELFEIRNSFTACAGALTAHMKKEELILFPFIRNMVKANILHQKPDIPPFHTIQNPVHLMMQEHETEGERFRKIAEWSNDYTPPADACATYTVAYSLLKEFENDLHTHIHLENNILFPMAVKTEETLKESMV